MGKISCKEENRNKLQGLRKREIKYDTLQWSWLRGIQITPLCLKVVIEIYYGKTKNNSIDKKPLWENAKWKIEKLKEVDLYSQKKNDTENNSVECYTGRY